MEFDWFINNLTYSWGDISLHTAASGCKFLQYNERQTKTSIIEHVLKYMYNYVSDVMKF
jgi:hypothetical protein